MSSKKKTAAKKNVNLTLTAQQRATLRRGKGEVPKGRINGTGNGTSEKDRAKMIELRAKDPDTFTLRRLACAFGLDPATVYYILNKEARKQQAQAREDQAKAEARSKAAKKAARSRKASKKAA